MKSHFIITIFFLTTLMSYSAPKPSTLGKYQRAVSRLDGPPQGMYNVISIADARMHDLDDERLKHVTKWIEKYDGRRELKNSAIGEIGFLLSYGIEDALSFHNLDTLNRVATLERLESRAKQSYRLALVEGVKLEDEAKNKLTSNFDRRAFIDGAQTRAAIEKALKERCQLDPDELALAEIVALLAMNGFNRDGLYEFMYESLQVRLNNIRNYRFNTWREIDEKREAKEEMDERFEKLYERLSAELD